MKRTGNRTRKIFCYPWTSRTPTSTTCIRPRMQSRATARPTVLGRRDMSFSFPDVVSSVAWEGHNFRGCGKLRSGSAFEMPLRPGAILLDLVDEVGGANAD